MSSPASAVRCADRGAANPARIAFSVALVLNALLAGGASASDLLSGDLAVDFPSITFTDTSVTSADVSPGAATYDVFFGSDSQYVVAAVATTDDSAGLDFANLYFATVPGTSSDLGFEVNNQDAFIPVNGSGPAIVGNYNQDGVTYPDVGIRYFDNFSAVTGQGIIEFAVPWTFFTQDPLDLGFTTPTDGVQFRVSQSFGYDFVGGGGTRFDPAMFGTVPVPTPEPASWLLMALGSLGLYAVARRRRRMA